jgi:hypothetical protein
MTFKKEDIIVCIKSEKNLPKGVYVVLEADTNYVHLKNFIPSGGWDHSRFVRAGRLYCLLHGIS